MHTILFPNFRIWDAVLITFSLGGYVAVKEQLTNWEMWDLLKSWNYCFCLVWGSDEVPWNVKRARKSHEVIPIIRSSFPHQDTGIKYMLMDRVMCEPLFYINNLRLLTARLRFVPEFLCISDFITKPKHTAMSVFFSRYAFCRLHFIRVWMQKTI